MTKKRGYSDEFPTTREKLVYFMLSDDYDYLTVKDLESEPLPFTDWPPILASALRLKGITRWSQLARIPERKLLAKPGFGEIKLRLLRVAVLESGRELPNILLPDAPMPGFSQRSQQWGIEGVARGVYFVQSGEFVKIGIAQCVVSRAQSFLTSNPHEIRPLGYVPIDALADASFVEREYHKRFEYLHHRGEWFRVSPELLEFIDQEAQPWPKSV